MSVSEVAKAGPRAERPADPRRPAAAARRATSEASNVLPDGVRSRLSRPRLT